MSVNAAFARAAAAQSEIWNILVIFAKLTHFDRFCTLYLNVLETFRVGDSED